MKCHDRRQGGARRRTFLYPSLSSRIRAPSTCAAILSCFFFFSLVDAQGPTPYPTHIFAQNPDAVISRTLPASASVPVGRIAAFFEDFSVKVDTDTRDKNKGESDEGDVDQATCNMQDSDQENSWASKAATYLGLRGLKKCETNCSTEREVENETLETDLPEWAKLLNTSAVDIAERAGRDAEWGKNVSGVSRFEYPDRENQNCTLWHTMGIRVGGTWYVQARVTSDTSDTQPNKVDSDNSYIIEHLRVTNDGTAKNGLGSIAMMLPLDANVTGFMRSNTSYEVWSRPSPDSVGVNADVSRNIAFRSALAKGDDEHQQAQDAEQVSNTAILLLPLAMNLVPVALIADVNTFGMLLYTALTDVLTAVPLCIKGVELINISRHKYRATSAQITGNRGSNETQVAEAWVAECTLKARHGHFQRGVIFVVLSISLMIFGVACEFVAKWWVKKRRAFLEDNNLPLMNNNYTQHPHAQNMGGSLGYMPSGQQGYQYQQLNSQGHTTGHQPFAAAALAMQNRAQAFRDGSGNNGIDGITSANRGAVPGSSLTSVVTPSVGHASTPGHNHGNNNNGLGPNCICACHLSGQGPIRPEYDSRATPDQMARKYH